MIYKSLLPLIITLTIMIAVTTYLINYVGHESDEALTYMNKYLLSIGVFRQLNKTLPSILQNEACILITNPINYTCETLGVNITNILTDALRTVTNETGGIAHYEIINYEVYGYGNETIYHAVITATVQNDEIVGVVGASYPVNLCLYSQVFKTVVSELRGNVTMHASNITEVAWLVNNYLAGRIKPYSNYIRISVHYEGVFSALDAMNNETTYLGQIYYVIYTAPVNEAGCGRTTVYAGDFYVVVIASQRVNETRYFSVSGVVSN